MLTSFSLAAYPIGGVLIASGTSEAAGDIIWRDIAGLLLIALAVIAAAPVLVSRPQRIVGEETARLDEWELQQRYRAIASAYATISAIIAALLFYAGLASDFGWWLPRGYDALNAIFWGFFLYVTLLPTFFLAWSLDEADAAEPFES